MRDDMGLFRGKRLDNGEWVYGNFLLKADGDPLLQITYSCIFDRQAVPVYPETVGEYTGLYDGKMIDSQEKRAEHGHKIFEGDILKTLWGSDSLYKVIHGNGMFMAESLSGVGTVPLAQILDDTTTEVIGNIHDNPEMEKGDK